MRSGILIANRAVARAAYHDVAVRHDRANRNIARAGGFLRQLERYTNVALVGPRVPVRHPR